MAISSRCALAIPLCGVIVTAAHAQPAFIYEQMCDASAAIALGPDRFVVANDERNALRIYQRGEAAPKATIDLSGFLGTKPDKESDIEGAAQIGSRIYWISSHGTNASGEFQKRRHRFFATDIAAPDNAPSLTPVGKPYFGLVADMAADPKLAKYKLGDAAKIAPIKSGGLNIEGLAATDDGRLLIGFRNPIPDGRALIVPLENPAAVIEGANAKFGAPIELDLGDLGIRSIERVGNRYLIVSGPIADRGVFALYRWSGSSQEPPVRINLPELQTLRPEALFAIPGADTAQILSDDGDVAENDVRCKDRTPDRQAFRSLVVKP